MCPSPKCMGCWTKEPSLPCAWGSEKSAPCRRHSSRRGTSWTASRARWLSLATRGLRTKNWLPGCLLRTSLFEAAPLMPCGKVEKRRSGAGHSPWRGSGTRRRTSPVRGCRAVGSWQTSFSGGAADGGFGKMPQRAKGQLVQGKVFECREGFLAEAVNERLCG